jgi:hypothetical protein
MTQIGACDMLRGVGRALTEAGHAVLTELPLGNGRRADLAALDRAGTIALVEVKSCRADFLADRKWPEYVGYCDRFYFAVARDFPLAVLPPAEGLILADRFGGEIVREAPLRALGAARRKAMLIRFGRAAAGRLHGCSTRSRNTELQIAARVRRQPGPRPSAEEGRSAGPMKTGPGGAYS